MAEAERLELPWAFRPSPDFKSGAIAAMRCLHICLYSIFIYTFRGDRDRPCLPKNSSLALTHVRINGANGENRTLILWLEARYNSHYTTFAAHGAGFEPAYPLQSGTLTACWLTVSLSMNIIYFLHRFLRGLYP